MTSRRVRPYSAFRNTAGTEQFRITDFYYSQITVSFCETQNSVKGNRRPGKKQPSGVHIHQNLLPWICMAITDQRCSFEESCVTIIKHIAKP